MSSQDYAVGYKKPPKQHQFKPGQSGNSRGRPNGARGLKTDLKAELEGRMTIRINGDPVTDTRQRLFVRALASKAATGDIRAAQTLSQLILQVLGTEDRGTARQTLSTGDQAILDELIKNADIGDSACSEGAPQVPPSKD
ncbi:DUF5681 domain-containing protein [Sphingomonas sp.]|uniref:DUF5681 domain-containing protein n=1 Tax=Sphingomonas sp. TaxID=28214 RepID=UPI0025D4AC02|nr:DUF5681 domain-containing protein [Sphingomonas sp.]